MQQGQNSMLMAVAGGIFLATYGPDAAHGGFNNGESLFAVLRRKLRHGISELKRQREFHDACVALEMLDDRLLRDMGIARHQIPSVLRGDAARD